MDRWIDERCGVLRRNMGERDENLGEGLQLRGRNLEY